MTEAYNERETLLKRIYLPDEMEATKTLVYWQYIRRALTMHLTIVTIKYIKCHHPYTLHTLGRIEFLKFISSIK